MAELQDPCYQTTPTFCHSMPSAGKPVYRPLRSTSLMKWRTTGVGMMYLWRLGKVERLGAAGAAGIADGVMTGWPMSAVQNAPQETAWTATHPMFSASPVSPLNDWKATPGVFGYGRSRRALKEWTKDSRAQAI